MILMTPKNDSKMIFYHPKIIPSPRFRRMTLCSVLWHFCDLWPQDKSIGTAATASCQDKSSGVPEAHHWSAGHLFYTAHVIFIHVNGGRHVWSHWAGCAKCPM